MPTQRAKPKAGRKPATTAKGRATKKAPSAKPGRPSSYRLEYAKHAYDQCLLGATDDDLARSFGVTDTTIKNWKRQHPEFLTSLKAGKDEADARVAKSLFHRALGYEHEAVKILTVALGNNSGSEVREVAYTERYPPDTTAAIFWLKNRRPRDWRDRQDPATTTPEQTKDTGVLRTPAPVTAEEWSAVAQQQQDGLRARTRDAAA